MPFLSKPSSEIKSLNNSDALQTAIAGIGEKIEKMGKSTAKNEKNSLEPQGFKRVSLGGDGGIRTHEPLRTT